MDSDIDSPQIGAMIKELQSQVDQYAPHASTEQSKGGMLSSFSFSSKQIYMIIPVIILVLLLYFQPGFVKYERLNEDGTTTYHLGFKSVIMWTLILSLVSALGLYGYFYKKAPAQPQV